MSLLKSRDLFTVSALPIVVDTADHRTMLQQEMHRHEYFEMLYVERGTLTNRFTNTDLRLKAGDVLIMKPYVLHVLLGNPKESRCKAYLCSFLPHAVDSGIQSLEGLDTSRSPNGYFFKSFIALADEKTSAVQLKAPSATRRKLIAAFSRLKTSTHDQSVKGSAMTRCHFLQLLAMLADQNGQNHGHGEAVKIEESVTVSRYKGGLRKALTYMHDHFSEPLSLKSVAALSGASTTYFCRLFRHETGMTFLHYTNSLRIERACVLLRSTSDTALEIAYKVGFSDYAHFGRQFKKHSGGVTPAEYRKKDVPLRRIREA